MIEASQIVAIAVAVALSFLGTRRVAIADAYAGDKAAGYWTAILPLLVSGAIFGFLVGQML